MARKYFETLQGEKIPLPVFFPDATRGVIRSLDSRDIENTKTPGVLVNTYHLYRELGEKVIKKHGNVKNFMNFHGGMISDSGGFQVMSIAKRGGGKITDEGVTFKSGKKKILLTPEESVRFQMVMGADMVVVLDDFTPPSASYEEAKDTVERTILWAKRSKSEFDRTSPRLRPAGEKPYILGVVQGGSYVELRKECAERLSEIGFDGFGYGGWPITNEGNFDYESAKVIAENTPEGYFLYGLGVGKPNEIEGLVKLGYNIFDCVLPTRDARHKRLYVFDDKNEKGFSYFVPDREKYYNDTSPVSAVCDCLLCKNYTRAYFSHLWRTGDMTAMRLATIHNLRFYAMLMERLRGEYDGR